MYRLYPSSRNQTFWILIIQECGVCRRCDQL